MVSLSKNPCFPEAKTGVLAYEGKKSKKLTENRFNIIILFLSGSVYTVIGEFVAFFLLTNLPYYNKNAPRSSDLGAFSSPSGAI